MIEHLPVLKPFQSTKEEYDELTTLANADNHGVFFPTDVIWKGGKRVGWFSVGAVPLLMSWVSTKGEMRVRDTLQMYNTVECVQQRLGAPGILIPCYKESPFFSYFEKIGYTKCLDDCACFFKTLR